MNTNLSELLAERERIMAYGLHKSLALIDAEIERLIHSSGVTPADRTAPKRVTAATAAPGKKVTA